MKTTNQIRCPKCNEVLMNEDIFKEVGFEDKNDVYSGTCTCGEVVDVEIIFKPTFAIFSGQ